MKPTESIKSGSDASVCGDCPARGMWCYVNVGQAPNSIYKTWERGGYQELNLNLFKHRAVRFGAWGDPAALPVGLLRLIANKASMYTGYTHAWRYCDQDVKQFCMASCDTEDDFYQARGMGWRTFRVRTSEDEPRLAKEVVCPASEEGGNKIQCIQCGACDGTARGLKGNIVITAHGSTASRYQEYVTENSPSKAA
jgi:hypothetical protein